MLQATVDELQLELSERKLRSFIRIGWPHIDPADYAMNWHIDAICDHLEAVAAGDIRRLIINIPPRHMKSLSVNVAFPAWVWAQRKRSALTGPGVGFLSTSYAQHLSVRDNLKCRRLLESPWYQRCWGDRFKLTGDQNTKIRFENDKGGYRIASSVEGTATGDGGDIIIIDDPISAGNALSPTYRMAAHEWFDGTMSTRLNDPKTGAYIIVMQRLHEDDLVGHVLDQARDDWTVLCLPARYERDHPLVYDLDPRSDPAKPQLLWPERMGEGELKKIETSLGSYGAAGQMQQRPAPREGGMFKRRWFEVVKAAPANLTCVRAWDLAATVPLPGTDPDWTVGVKMGRCSEGFIWLLEVKRFRETAAGVERNIKSTATQDGRHVAIRLPEDPGSGGKAWTSSLTRMLVGWVVRKEKPTGSKETRASPFAAQCEAGNVRVLDGEWNKAFFDEIENFPFGKHDDQVDAASDAFNELFDVSGSNGFMQMVAEDNMRSKRIIVAEDQVAAAKLALEAACPYPPGSVEHLRWHGLVE